MHAPMDLFCSKSSPPSSSTPSAPAPDTTVDAPVDATVNVIATAIAHQVARQAAAPAASPAAAGGAALPATCATAPLAERLAAARPIDPHPTGIGRADALLAGHPIGTGCTSSGFAPLDAELPGGGWPQGQLVELLLDTPGIGEIGLLLPALAQVAGTGRATVWVLPHDHDRLPAPAAPAASSAAALPTRSSEPAALPSVRPARPSCSLPHFPPGALPYAPALADAGLDLARCIFVQPATPREALWSLEQSLRATHLGAVIGWLPDSASPDAAFRALRRLHLLAQRHQALVFVLRPSHAATAPSPAVLRVRLQAQPGAQAMALHVTLLKRRGRPLLDPVAVRIPTQPAALRPSLPAALPLRRPALLLSQPLPRSSPIASAAPPASTRQARAAAPAGPWPDQPVRAARSVLARLLPRLASWLPLPASPRTRFGH